MALEFFLRKPISGVARACLVASARVTHVISSLILKVIRTSKRSLGPLIMPVVSFLEIRLIRVMSSVLARLKAGVYPLPALVAIFFPFVHIAFILLTLIHIVAALRVANIPFFLFSKVVILPLIVPMPLSRWLVLTRSLALFRSMLKSAPFFHEQVARLDAFLDSWVVRKHAAFGVFNRDFPVIEDLLLMHVVDCFICRSTRREHNIREALGHVRFQVTHQVHVLDRSKTAKLLPYHIFRDAARQASNINVAVLSKTNPAIFACFLVKLV